jgi:hypothetical protein
MHMDDAAEEVDVTPPWPEQASLVSLAAGVETMG